MKKQKRNSEKGHIVVFWDGYNKEGQSFDPKSRLWEFDIKEAEEQCRKEVSKGAVRCECWKINTTPPEMVLAFKRGESGGCIQTFPDTRREYKTLFSKKEE